MTDKNALILVAILFAVAIAFGVLEIIWAVDCGNKGGAYIIPQNSLPVCVAGVK